MKWTVSPQKFVHCPLFRINGFYTLEGADNSIDMYHFTIQIT